MKKIEAIIREEKLDTVKKALEENSYFGMTVSQVSGRGKQQGITLQWRVGEHRVDLLPKLKLELVVLDEDVMAAVDAIVRTARTGETGDGKVFILPSPPQQILKLVNEFISSGWLSALMSKLDKKELRENIPHETLSNLYDNSG